MDNVGINAVSDFCRHVANNEEIDQLRADLIHRELELVRRAEKLKPNVDPMAVTRQLVGDADC